MVKALLDLPGPHPKILALTRNTKSAKSEALAHSRPEGEIELVQGDATEPKPIFESRPKGSIGGIFVVTTPGSVDEEKQGIPLIDEAVAHGVKHVVFSSVDRGGNERSWENPTNVKHFYQKHNIEIHLRDKARKEAGAFTWTVLRPAAFLDNMNPGIFCSLFVAMWAASLKPETKLQFVSVHDIGVFAAKALANPEKWSGKAVGLAGDELTLDEAKAKFKRVTGSDPPQSWTLVGKAMLWTVGDLGDMFSFFEKEGYGVDIAALREEESRLQNFETWLKEDSQWKGQKE